MTNIILDKNNAQSCCRILRNTHSHFHNLRLKPTGHRAYTIRHHIRYMVGLARVTVASLHCNHKVHDAQTYQVLDTLTGVATAEGWRSLVSKGELATWRKSKASGDDNCVEVRITDSSVDVRHSAEPNGSVLSFTHGEWHAFLTGVRSGEFSVAAHPDRANG